MGTSKEATRTYWPTNRKGWADTVRQSPMADAVDETPSPPARMDLIEQLRIAYGVGRSLAIYYGKPWHFRQMDESYARFVRPGDLCFDLGAHVGNRIRSWRSLGARVVAVEPQPALARLLRWLYGRDRDVHLVEAAISEALETVHLNLPNPTLATAAAGFIERAASAESFRGERWQRTIEVEGEERPRQTLQCHRLKAFHIDFDETGLASGYDDSCLDRPAWSSYP